MRGLALVALVACGGGAPAPAPTAASGVPVTVEVSYAGAWPEDIETAVVLPLEQVLSGQPKVTTVRSLATVGRARIVLWFASGTDASEAALGVASALDGARARLPAEVAPPTVQRGDPDAPPDLAYLARSDKLPRGDISELLQRGVADQVAGQAGTSRVEVRGATSLRIEVAVDADRARAMGITTDELITAIVDAKMSDVAALESVVIAQLSHVPVLVKDVATVARTAAPPDPDEPLGLAIWLQSPAQRTAIAGAVAKMAADASPLLVLEPAPASAPRSTYILELVGPDHDALDAAASSIAADLPSVTFERAHPAATQRRVDYEIDPAQAARLNVPVQRIELVTRALQAPLVRPGGTFEFLGLGSERDLDRSSVRGSDGAAIPLSMLVTATGGAGALPRYRIDRQPALAVNVHLGSGSLGDLQHLLGNHPKLAHDGMSKLPRARLVTRK